MRVFEVLEAGGEHGEKPAEPPVQQEPFTATQLRGTAGTHVGVSVHMCVCVSR